MLSGSSSLKHGDDTEINKLAPCITLTPPDTPYQVRFGGVGKTWSEMWAFFPPNPPHEALARQLLPPDHGPLYSPLDPEIVKTIKTQFQLLLAYDQLAAPSSSRLIDHGLTTILMTLDGLNSPQPDSRLREAAAYLASAPELSISLDEVARHAGMSPSSLSHRFKESFHCTPMRYREIQRLKQAAALLLATDLPLKDVAVQLGFADAFHFSRRFRKHFGQSPSRYRQTGSI